VLLVRDCAQVVGSRLRARGYPLALPYPYPGGTVPVQGIAGAWIEDSSVWLSQSEIYGNATRPPLSGTLGDGGLGIVALDSRIQLARTIVRGAQSGGRLSGVPGFGGVGLSATQSTIVVHGGVDNMIVGPPAFEYLAPGTVGLGLAASAVALDGSSSLTYASDAVFLGGSASTSFPPAPAFTIAAGASLVALPHRLPTVSFADATVALGATLTIDISGQPGVDHVRAVALETAPSVAVPGALGALLVDLATVVAFDVVPLGPTGTASISVQVPNDPALAGIEVVEQAAQLLPTGIVISPAAFASLGF
jgi:hypothetical protein